MTVDCAIVNVLLPANITAISIIPSSTACTEPCDLTVDVTWQNFGEVAGIFEPAITVDGIRTALPPETLDPGLSVMKTFDITGLTMATHTICPDPN